MICDVSQELSDECCVIDERLPNNCNRRMRSRVVRFSFVALLFSCGLGLAALIASAPAAEKPAESSAPAATNTQRSSLPAPFSESLFTFLQIEQQKQDLKERIVRVEISKVLGEGDESGNLLRFIAKDTSKSASPYGQVAFPREGLEKTGLRREGKGPLVVYFRVHVVSAKAAAICEAVGTKFSSDARGTHYDW